ncbi:MAG: type 4a pilus biogenesis protein PilO [Pirellulaceae bacterium]
MQKPHSWPLTLACTAGLAAFVGLFLVPAHRSLSSLRREVSEKRNFVAQVELQAASAPDLEALLTRTREHVTGWRTSAPSEPNLVGFLGRLGQLADEAGIRVHRLTPQLSVDLKVLRQHSLTLELEGEYPQLVSFLSRLEELPETVWIRHLQVTPHRQNATHVQCELILTVFADNREISG